MSTIAPQRHPGTHTSSDRPARNPEHAALVLGPAKGLSCEDVERVALRQGGQVVFSPEALLAMDRSVTALRAAHARGDAIYGLTTGFGPHVVSPASDDALEQGDGLIAHLGAGCGPLAADAPARAAMCVRAATIAQGRSAIDPRAAQALVSLLSAGVTPAVPAVGSVGASGDLIPLAHVARVIAGKGRVLCPASAGGTRPAIDALRDAGLAPVALSGRDALAIVNGTAFMTAYAALAVARAQRLLLAGERLTGWAYRLLGCRAQALDPRLHTARNHPNQEISAANILAESSRHGAWEDATRPLQEVYSLRCAPQILGACRDNAGYARVLIERELGGVNDNPLVCDAGPGGVLHGGNFQGQQVAFACDALNAALVQSAVLAERQLDVLCNPEFTGATLLLAWRPGATSGVAGAQITATALVAEMRAHGLPAATASIPTNGRNQDVVSMGTLAARQAYGQTERLARVLAILTIGVRQLAHLRESGRCAGRTTPTPAWAPEYEPFTHDRALHEDIERLASAYLATSN